MCRKVINLSNYTKKETLQRKDLYTCTITISTHLLAPHHTRMSQTPTGQFSVFTSPLQRTRQTVRYLCFTIPSSIPFCHLADCTFIMYKYAYDTARLFSCHCLRHRHCAAHTTHQQKPAKVIYLQCYHMQNI